MNITLFNIFMRNLLKRLGRSNLKKLRDSWGTIPENEVDIETAELCFQFNKENSIDNSYLIDDDTWRDLDLDDLLVRGCEWLQDYLRNPNAILSAEDRMLCDDILIEE